VVPITLETWTPVELRERINAILADMRETKTPSIHYKVLQLLLDRGIDIHMNIGDTCCHIHKGVRMRDSRLLSMFLTVLTGRNRKNALKAQSGHWHDKVVATCHISIVLDGKYHLGKHNESFLAETREEFRRMVV
jgi:hypothetical protein